MQKIKHFKVSVIMHTMSKATYDQNIFYTSDSELLLKFELIEKEFSYDRGEILLFNETDKSFVTRTLDKVDDGFVYQIESDIIRHHGEWTGQLQLVKNGEVYTSKPFNFTIENDLSTVSPPPLVDFDSWLKLKQSAIDLIDDMKNIISEYDKAALDFQQAENVRMNNETGRKQAESTRQNHETIRQNQERVRERNEDVRKDNEVSRTETFNTNEAARQVNETTRLANESQRQQAEQSRVSAESIRVGNENQRVIDHANRSAEFDSKADKIILKNEVANGDFSDGINGFTVRDGELNIVEGVAIFTPSVPSSRFFVGVRLNYGDTLYVFTKVKSNSSDVSLGEGLDVRGRYTDINNWEFLSYAVSFNYNIRYPSIISHDDSQRVVEVQHIGVLNLTKTFGAGNEPTKDEMDRLIEITGYIDGEYALNNKEMLIWTLALIRKNKNAIIALGGTI